MRRKSEERSKTREREADRGYWVGEDPSKGEDETYEEQVAAYFAIFDIF